MKKYFFVLILLFFVFVCAEEFIDLNDLRIGMKGYCATVFHGTDIDTFQVEIIDIMKDSNMEMILVKCSGENVEKTGVAAGMSGSPVYFQGKLAGSLSYTWDNLKEPVGGVIPIKKIIEIKNYENQNKKKNFEFKEISVPIVFYGFSNEVLDLAEKQNIFSKSSIIAGGNNINIKDTKKSELIPGKAIAIKLIEGDFEVSAIGTVTYVDQKNIYSLGHPFTLKGEVDFPVSEAYIYTILPKNDISFKMGFPLKDNVGKAKQDRTFGVYAVGEEKSEMVKVSMKVNEKLYNFSIVNDKDIISNYLPLTFLSTISKNFKSGGNLSVKYRIEVFGSNKKSFEYKNMFSGDNILLQMFFDISGLFTAYTNNIYRTIKIDSVKIESEVVEQNLVFMIDDIITDKKYYRNGENLRLLIKLKGYDKEMLTKELEIKIPDNIKDDSIMVTVNGGGDDLYFESSRSSGKFDFKDIETLENIIDQINPSNSLIVRLVSFEKGFIDNNLEFFNYPTSFVKEQLMMGKKMVNGNNLVVKRFSTDFVIKGTKSIVLKLWR
ncbi:MAG: hypothetical protein ABIN35_05050 [candidate division WOR-3 bacterium]